MGQFGFGQTVRKLSEYYGKVLFYETHFEESNINRNPIIIPLYDNNEIWTKIMDDFGFGQSVQKLSENYGKVLFYETYFEESNINRKPLIQSRDKRVMKFRPKKWVSLVFDKVYENCLKIKKKCYFTKLTSKGVISTGAAYLVPW